MVPRGLGGHGSEIEEPFGLMVGKAGKKKVTDGFMNLAEPNQVTEGMRGAEQVPPTLAFCIF